MNIQTQYGEWRVMELRGKKALCECSCGVTREVWRNNLTSGKSRSCGHVRENYTTPNIGDTVEQWTVLDYVGPHHVSAQCSCGKIKKVYKYTLGQDSKSCGHDRLTGPRSRLTWMWKWMHSRCYNSADPMFKYYGLRGVHVDERWHDLDSYINWALANGWKKQAGLQIDRVDNDGPYSPDNCRVCSIVDNANNKSNNVWLTAFGETKTLAQWGADSRCIPSTEALRGRIQLGWEPELAITAPKYSQLRTAPQPPSQHESRHPQDGHR